MLLHCLPLLLYCLPFVVDGFDEFLGGVVPHLVVAAHNDLVALSQQEIRNVIVWKMILFEVVDLVVFNLSEQPPLLNISGVLAYNSCCLLFLSYSCPRQNEDELKNSYFQIYLFSVDY